HHGSHAGFPEPRRPETEPIDRQPMRQRVRDAHAPRGLSGIDCRLLAHRDPRRPRRRDLKLETDALDLAIDVLARGLSHLEILDGFSPEQADDGGVSLARSHRWNQEPAYPHSDRRPPGHVELAPFGS